MHKIIHKFLLEATGAIWFKAVGAIQFKVVGAIFNAHSVTHLVFRLFRIHTYFMFIFKYVISKSGLEI